MNGSYGVLSKEYEDIESANIFYNIKYCDYTTKNIKLIKCEVIKYK